MINLTLIEAYDPIVQFKDLAFFDLSDGDAISFEYELNLGSPHKLKLSVSPQFAHYEYLKTSETFGVRLETETLNLAFVYFDRKVVERGVLEIELFSSIYKLQRSPLKNFNQVDIGVSLADYLLTVGNNVLWVPLQPDREVNVVAGALTNYELMEEAIKYPFFYNWVEGGIDTSGSMARPIIFYGDFRNVEAFYNANSSDYPQLKPLTAYSLNNVDNDEQDQAIITSYEVIENSVKFNLVLAYVNTGGGASEDNTILFEPNAPYVNPQYPVVTVEGVNYVLVPNAPQAPQRIQIYPVNESGSIQNANGDITLSSEISAETAYRKTVAYIQSYQATKSFNFEFALKKMTLAGVPIKVRFKETIKDLDGQVTVLQDLDQTVIPTSWQGSGDEIFN